MALNSKDSNISFQDFEKLDIRVGTILEVEPFPEARIPAYKLRIDFGHLGILKSSAQITRKYKIEELSGRQVLAVVNFAPKQIGPIMSECLVLGAVMGDTVHLLIPSARLLSGSPVQ